MDSEGTNLSLRIRGWERDESDEVANLTLPIQGMC